MSQPAQFLLETGTLHNVEATEHLLHTVFAPDASRGDHVRLLGLDGGYLQISGSGHGPFAVEYAEGAMGQHYHSSKPATLAEAEAMFLDYFQGGIAWRNGREWTTNDPAGVPTGAAAMPAPQGRFGNSLNSGTDSADGCFDSCLFAALWEMVSGLLGCAGLTVLLLILIHVIEAHFAG